MFADPAIGEYLAPFDSDELAVSLAL